MSSLGGEASGTAKYPELDIQVPMLKLDEMNFRTDEVDNQRAAIRAMIDEQGNGLVALAEHYLKHGLMPGERLIVIPDDTSGEPDSYVVMEGNRRTTILKLLANPSLADDTPVFGRFSELSRRFEESPRRTLPCVVLPDRETALIWVEVKHSAGMAGAGVEKWNSPARDRFSIYMGGRVVRWISTIRFLSANGVDTSEISRNIFGKTTAVSRVLNSGAMREVLGVRFIPTGTIEFENGNLQAGVNLLKSMLEEMASSRFNTNRVHSFDDREKFIRGFEALSVKLHKEDDERADEGEADDQNSAGKKSGGGGQNGAAAGGETNGRSQGGRSAGTESGHGEDTKGADQGRDPSRGVRRGSSQRLTLASKKREDALHIKVERLNDIYKEALRLKVGEHPAVASVIIRVFVELSCENYLSEKEVPIPDFLSNRNKGRETTWHSQAVKFREKIEACVTHIDPDKKKSTLNDVRAGLGAQDQLQSPESLHRYVHGLEAIPSARDLVIIWDRYRPLFAAIFS